MLFRGLEIFVVGQVRKNVGDVRVVVGQVRNKVGEIRFDGCRILLTQEKFVVGQVRNHSSIFVVGQVRKFTTKTETYLC
jgi:hypothetical protein